MKTTLSRGTSVSRGIISVTWINFISSLLYNSSTHIISHMIQVTWFDSSEFLNELFSWKKSLDYIYNEILYLFHLEGVLASLKARKSEYLEYFMNFISRSKYHLGGIKQKWSSESGFKNVFFWHVTHVTWVCHMVTRKNTVYVTKRSTFKLVLIAVIHFSCLFIDTSASSVWSSLDFATNFIHTIHHIQLALIAVNAFFGWEKNYQCPP